MNGSLLPGFDGVLGGGLLNVTPSTVGETDGLIVPVLAEGVVVPPPLGGVVVPPLAGRALLLGVVVGNPVVAVQGTTSREDTVDSGLGVVDGGMTAFDDGGSARSIRTTLAEVARKPSSEPERRARGVVITLFVLGAQPVVCDVRRLGRDHRAR